jgi:hypothetical protein
LRDALACSFVPSTAITPTCASPLRAHSVSTSPNRAGDRVLMALNEPRDRRVIRALLGRQDAEGDVFFAGALDHPRGPDPTRIRVQQHRDHHRRVIRRPAAPVDPVRGIERLEIHLRDGIDDKPREVPLRQPLTDVGRHQNDCSRSHATKRWPITEWS